MTRKWAIGLSTRTITWLSVIGSVASIAGLAWYFMPSRANTSPKQPSGSSQSASVNGSGMSVVGGHDVSVNINSNSPESEKIKLPPLFPGETDFKKLASPALNRQFVGQTVTFRAMAVGEQAAREQYKIAGVPLDDFVLLNHRDVEYRPGHQTDATDVLMPNFPVLVPSRHADWVFDLKRGDCVLISGKVMLPHPDAIYKNYSFDYAKIYVVATGLKKIGE
jgi:hypothetical protein